MRTLSLSLVTLLFLAGCHANPAQPIANATAHAEANAAAQKQQQAELDVDRQALGQIPPPSKSRYTTIHTLSSWENPYITIGSNILTLHVLLADANPSAFGVGGMTRPLGARRRDLNIRVSDLPQALSAIPQSAWPYGRVIALEEAHNTPASAQPQVRRTMESAMQQLGNLGVVMYEAEAGGRSIED